MKQAASKAFLLLLSTGRAGVLKRFIPKFSLRHVLIALICFSSISAHGQTVVPNGGFEEWAIDSVHQSSTYPAGTAFIPLDWGGGTFGGTVNDTLHTIFRSTDAHSGLYALGGKVVPEDTIGPLLRTTSWYSFDSLNFPIVGSPTDLEGWYKFKSVSNDFLEIILYFFNQNNNRILGHLIDSISKDTYTHFSIPLPHEDSGSGYIEITLGNAHGRFGHAGTEFVIDDLTFTGLASVSTPNVLTSGLESSNPNPFNESTTIRYSLASDAKATLEVLNLLGERVALLHEGPESQGEHQVLFNGHRFASGTYLCRLITPQGVSSRFIQLSH